MTKQRIATKNDKEKMKERKTKTSQHEKMENQKNIFDTWCWKRQKIIRNITQKWKNKKSLECSFVEQHERKNLKHRVVKILKI